MNYRHAFHAGNFSDVLKHTVLVRVLTYLKHKPAPFRVIDTHAGTGLYDVRSDAAQRTNEWRDGIEKILMARFSEPVETLLAPYLDAVRALNPDGMLHYYPGSPKLVADLLRPDDRLIVNELHHEDAQELKRVFARQRQVKVMTLDGWTVLKAVLPPKERRGLSLIDPPFEQPGELDRLLQSVRDQQRRFASGVQILWYPVKDQHEISRFHERLKAQGLKSCLYCQLSVDRVVSGGPIKSCGVTVINPPYPLYDELALLLPELRTTLCQGRDATDQLAWLVSE